MLQNELTPKQQQEKKYKRHYDETTGDIKLTHKQRSWVCSMLRNKMGHKNVALFMFTHGSTPLFDNRHLDGSSTELLNSALADALEWHASLIKSMVAHESQPYVEHRRVLECKDELPG